MTGIYFDFEKHDVVIKNNGSFKTDEIDSQNCALIACSEICLLTAPHVGERLPAKLYNRRMRNAKRDIARAIRAVERDGGKSVRIWIDEHSNLQFKANYG